MLMEVVCNEIAIPNVLAKICVFTKEMYGSEIIDGYRPYSEAVINFMRQYFAVLTPLPLKSFSKLSEKHVHDAILVEEFVSVHIDIDKQSRIVKLKPGLQEKIGKQGIDSDMLWYDQSEYSAIDTNLSQKYPSNDHLIINQPSSTLNKALLDKLYSTTALEELAEKFESIKEKPYIEHVLKAFFKTLIICMSQFQQGKSDANSLRKLLDGPLESIISSIEKIKDYYPQSLAYRERFNDLRRRYLNDTIEHDSEKNKTILAQLEETRKEQIKILFDKKRKAIFDKIVNRKKQFMVVLDKDSDKLVQSLIKTNEDIQCPLTQEKLNNEKTYFTLCHTHWSNLVQFAKVTTLNQMLKDQSLDQSKEEFEQLAALRDKALEKCKKVDTLLLTSCKHAISRDGLINLDNQAQLYAQDEAPCPLCKAPVNLFLPCFKKTVFDALNAPSIQDIEKFNNTTLKDYTADLMLWLQNQKSDTPLLKETVVGDHLKDILASEKQVVENFSSSLVSVFFIYNDLFERATNKKITHQPCLEELTKRSFVTLLKYIELYGLPNVVNDFSQIYHNLYLSMRISQLMSLDNEQGFNQANKEGYPIRLMLAARISSYLTCCDEESVSFKSADIENEFTNLLIDSVNSFSYPRASYLHVRQRTRTL